MGLFKFIWWGLLVVAVFFFVDWLLGISILDIIRAIAGRVWDLNRFE